MAQAVGLRFGSRIASSVSSMEVLDQHQFRGRLIVLRIEQRPAVGGKAQADGCWPRDAPDSFRLATCVVDESDQHATLSGGPCQVVNAFDSQKKNDSLEESMGEFRLRELAK